MDSTSSITASKTGSKPGHSVLLQTGVAVTANTTVKITAPNNWSGNYQEQSRQDQLEIIRDIVRVIRPSTVPKMILLFEVIVKLFHLQQHLPEMIQRGTEAIASTSHEVKELEAEIAQQRAQRFQRSTTAPAPDQRKTRSMQVGAPSQRA